MKKRKLSVVNKTETENVHNKRRIGFFGEKQNKTVKAPIHILQYETKRNVCRESKEFTRKNESMDEPIDYFISNE